MLPKGYKVDRRGRGKHIYLLGPDGETVRDKRTGMPVTFSNSPSGNWEDKVERDIKSMLEE